MIVARWAAIVTVLCGIAAAPCHAVPGLMESLDQSVCRTIEHSAQAAHLPVEFVTRVIWHESSFRAGVVSSAGAEGIAQFMPATAQARGLADPFDPEQAIPKAAHYLGALRQRFGNIGIAAAAYNAGEARVTNWLHGQGGLPAATRSYVRFVTGRDAEEWRNSGSTNPSNEAAVAELAEPQSCLTVTADLRRSGGRGGTAAGSVAAEIWAPWGVQLAGNFSKALALATFDRARARYASVIGNERPMIIGRLLRSRGTKPFYQVRLPAPTRAVAEQLCGRIQAVGGACVAMPSA
ncbi:MAG: lytic transglycosylase domain-containing protein [Alphaproteobacteria bacterium]|nr:lytic transglycosylase domain-containing protein [Alphaproteobacteria bacterium]